MTFIDIFAWFVLLLLIASGIAVIVLLGMWPGRVAHARGHSQAEAIAIGSWLTLFLGFVFWPFVAIWAHMNPVAGSPKESGDALARKLHALEHRLTRVEASTAERSDTP